MDFHLLTMNYVFSYNRLGRNADEADAEVIINMATNASLTEQQKQVQENIHEQIKLFSMHMDGILLPNKKMADNRVSSSSERTTATRRSGLGFAVGNTVPLHDNPGKQL